MTVTTATNNNRFSLRNILFANATFSLITGAILIAVSGSIGEFLGTSRWVPIVVGAFLLPWAAFAFTNGRREKPHRRDTWLTIAGDLAWVVGAAVVILWPDSLSTGGKWALGIVSAAVLDFAVFQWVAIRRGW